MKYFAIAFTLLSCLQKSNSGNSAPETLNTNDSVLDTHQSIPIEHAPEYYFNSQNKFFLTRFEEYVMAKEKGHWVVYKRSKSDDFKEYRECDCDAYILSFKVADSILAVSCGFDDNFSTEIYYPNGKKSIGKYLIEDMNNDQIILSEFNPMDSKSQLYSYKFSSGKIATLDISSSSALLYGSNELLTGEIITSNGKDFRSKLSFYNVSNGALKDTILLDGYYEPIYSVENQILLVDNMGKLQMLDLSSISLTNSGELTNGSEILYKKDADFYIKSVDFEAHEIKYTQPDRK